MGTSQDTRVERAAWHCFVVVAAILLLALTFRLSNLHTSLGYDGLATFQESQDTTRETLIDYVMLAHLIHIKSIDKTQIANALNICFPGYYALNNAYIALSHARTDASVRVLPAVLSFLTVVILAVLGWKFIGPHGAVAAALLGAFSPLLQYYGSYIRFYAALAFFSALAYLFTLLVIADLRKPRPTMTNRASLIILCALVWIPLTVHAAGALPLFICTYLIAVFVVPRVQRTLKAWTIIAYCLIGTPVAANTFVFLYARVTDTSTRSTLNVMSSSLVSLLASLFFNFNGLIYLTIAFSLALGYGQRLRLKLLYAPFLLCLGGASLAVVYRHELFRPDYLSSLLPISYFLCADSLENIAAAHGGGTAARRTVYLVLGFVLLFSLPSFVSNLVIDQDGLDYTLALRDIRSSAPGRRVLVFTHSPANFPPDPDGNVRVAHLNEEGAIDERQYEVVLYALGWRREGFQKTFVSIVPRDRVAEILKSSNLIKISGKPRLDLRDNLFFIFQRDPHGGTMPR